MSDRVTHLLELARTDAMRDVRPPGAAEVRRTVRRRRGVAAGTATAVVVAGITAVGALAGPPRSGPAQPVAGPSAMPSDLPMMPEPDAATVARMEAADAALGDRTATPWVMSTGGVVSPNYANNVNDIPAGAYDLFVYCVGRGTVDAVVKAGEYGDDKLAAGVVNCADSPTPARLAVRQPVDGYLQVYLAGDEAASAGSAFSFKFVRAEPKVTAEPAAVANAAAAAALLPGSTPVTTERDLTVEKPLAAGRYLVDLACRGPGTLSFTVRSAGVLRDGTVATDGRTELEVDRSCASGAQVSVQAPVTLAAGQAITVTAVADDAARNSAGWAYAIRPA